LAIIIITAPTLSEFKAENHRKGWNSRQTTQITLEEKIITRIAKTHFLQKKSAETSRSTVN